MPRHDIDIILRAEMYSTICYGVRDKMNLTPEEFMVAVIVQYDSCALTWPDEFKRLKQKFGEGGDVFKDRNPNG